MASALGSITVEGQVTDEAFVQFPLAVMQRSDLPTRTRLVYAALLWYEWDCGKYPGNAQLSEEFGIPRSSLRKDLQTLQETGLIETTRHGAGKTNSYRLFLPGRPLTMSGQSDSFERSDRSDVANHPYKDSKSVADLTRKKESSVSSFENSSFENKDDLIEEVAKVLPRDDETSSVCSHLRKFSTDVIRQAAEITANQLPLNNPISYLYGVLKNLNEQRPSYHKSAPDPVEALDVQERRESRKALAEVTEAFSQSVDISQKTHSRATTRR